MNQMFEDHHPDLAKIRDMFPVTQRYAYLNHAHVAAPPLPVVEAMTRYLNERSLAGGEAMSDLDERIESARQLAARFIDAHRDEIIFTRNVSHGLNIVAAGLDWQPGDNIICAETEFPANVYPWTNLNRRGVETRFVSARDNRILVKDIAALIDARTRLVAISFVEFDTGYRNDLDALATVCHENGVYLCVDGMQGLGALQFSVSRTPVDFLATHSPKWMLGPNGAGFLYVRRDLLKKLDPVMTGWRAVVDRNDYYRYDSPLRPGGERFEEGSLNFAGIIGMEAGLDLILGVGLATIESRIMALTDSLIAGLQKLGYIITSPIANPRERSGIISFRHPAVETAMLAEHLQAAGVIVSLRGDVIRVSPHFYNTETEIQRLLDALPPL